MAAVSNLSIEMGTLKPFFPTATSRIGIDVAALQTGGHEGPARLVSGPPQVPAFKLMLSTNTLAMPSETLSALRARWQSALQGTQMPVDVVVAVNVDGFVKGGTEAVKLTLRDCWLTGFSDGSITPAYMILRPEGVVSLEPVPMPASAYAEVDLPVLASPLFEIAGTEPMTVHRFSGGETVITIEENHVGETRLPGVTQILTVSDLALTAVARHGGLKSGFDLDLFTPLFSWVEAVIQGENTQRTIAIKSLAAVKGQPDSTLTFPDAVPTRFNFVNPLLVDPLTGIAPFVFDMRIRPQQP
jgi:hypothetical protein